MKKTVRKLISLILAVTMIVSAFCGVTISAAESGYYQTIISENYEVAKPVEKTNGYSVVT